LKTGAWERARAVLGGLAGHPPIVGPPYARPAVPGALGKALAAAREAFADIPDDEWDRALAADPSPMRLQVERDEAIAERDAAQSELAGARRLLAMATAFDAGPLLGDVPVDWSWGPFQAYEATYEVEIVPVKPGDRRIWFAEQKYNCWRLTSGADWVKLPPVEAITAGCGFPSPVAALAALDAWRAARRAEIAGREPAAQQAAEPTTGPTP
jgi:hypothetical protein